MQHGCSATATGTGDASAAIPTVWSFSGTAGRGASTLRSGWRARACCGRCSKILPRRRANRVDVNSSDTQRKCLVAEARAMPQCKPCSQSPGEAAWQGEGSRLWSPATTAVGSKFLPGVPHAGPRTAQIGNFGGAAGRGCMRRLQVKETGVRNGAIGADKFGFDGLEAVHWNLTEPRLYEFSVRAGEAELAYGGALCADTGVHTGRSPKDQFIVRDALTDKTVWWDNNGTLTPEQFERLYQDFLAHARGKTLFAQDLYGGADPAYRIKTRVYTEFAWHSLFIRALLIRPQETELKHFVPELTIVDLPSFKADPKRHGVRTETIIAIDFSRKIVLIGGTNYAGEMKKSVFTTLNYYLPKESVMPMHCSANIGPKGDVALFFGLSGTGKTTLSADPSRTLIGDDEHGWPVLRIFIFDGGSCAKDIKP